MPSTYLYHPWGVSGSVKLAASIGIGATSPASAACQTHGSGGVSAAIMQPSTLLHCHADLNFCSSSHALLHHTSAAYTAIARAQKKPTQHAICSLTCSEHTPDEKSFPPPCLSMTAEKAEREKRCANSKNVLPERKYGSKGRPPPPGHVSWTLEEM